MHVNVTKTFVQLTVDKHDIQDWGEFPPATWPCSTLQGCESFVAEFDENGLVDLTVKGKSTDEIDGHELSCICSDLLVNILSSHHPVYEVIVAQHQPKE